MANTTNEIIGYRVVNTRDQVFVDHNPSFSGSGNFQTSREPTPISRGDAFRRLAAFLDAFPEEDHQKFAVEPVYRELTPIESSARELGSLLSSLCQRHGINLGMSQAEIEAQLVRELRAFGAR
jgi:hypothetical protein